MPSAEEILDRARTWNILSERQARETRRTVFLVDDLYVIKQFEIPAAVRNYRRPWITEDTGLRRLDGQYAPRCHGYVERTKNGMRTAWLIKEYLPGTPCTTFLDSDIPDVAALMAGLHRKLMITDDANVQNFLRTRDGRLMFVDLGRARIFVGRSPWLMLHIGWELAKLRREGFAWNEAQWRAFLPEYFFRLTFSRLDVWLIQCACEGAVLLRMVRKTLQGKPRRS